MKTGRTVEFWQKPREFSAQWRYHWAPTADHALVQVGRILEEWNQSDVTVQRLTRRQSASQQTGG